MPGPLDGRVALVTGAGRGIGRAEALALAAAAGAKVVVNDVGLARDGTGSDRGPADDAVEAIRAGGGEAVAAYDSVADWDAAAAVVQTAVDAFGRLDIVVNNAGISTNHLIAEVTEEEYDTVVAINLKGTFAICRHAIPALRRGGYGRIVNTASNQWAAPTGGAPYAASKGGVVSLTYDLAWELREEGITVNAVAPFASTRLTTDMEERDAQLRAAGLMSARRQSVKEARAPAELVPPMVVYLAGEEAAHVTGCVFRTGGGKIGLYSHPTEWRAIFRDEATGPWPHDELVDLLPRTVLRGDVRAPHI